MKTMFKKNGKRVLSAALCLLMAVMSLPLSAFAWTSEEGRSCTSSFGDYYVGLDGEYYRSQATMHTLVYNDDGSTYVKSYSSGNAKRKYLMTDNSGTHQVYCVESGIDFNTGNTYTSKSGQNSSYFKNLPTDAQFGVMMALMYGWHEGKSSPVAGTNADDYAYATQSIIWEYQQQLRTSPADLHSANGIPADMYYSSIKGRPAEKCYNWILSQMADQGEVIHISATSENHINAMDMNSDYGDGANPVILKSEFILSLCEQLIGGSTLGAKQKSIIDRCTASVYRHYQQGNYMGVPPTLQDFREELLKQNEPEAQEIALAIELFTDGSLNTFAKHTNVDTHSRLICYDILDLGKQLQPIGMLVVLDSILNRITQNRAKGRNTFIFIDEIYLLFQHEYSANFLFTLWKRVRKYGAYCTGITQNVDDLLQSHTARTMLANSEFIIMLNQASTDRLELAKLLNISDLQMSYITNVGAGQGLLKVGSSLVPFVNKFPRNTELYRLMTTKFGEV